MKKILILVAAMLLVASMAFGANTIVGSRHDMNLFVASATTQVCVYCHTPHQASTANKQAPLWNHSFGAPTGNYGVYASGTMNATPTDFGNEGPGTASTSKLCMTCHDGIVAVSALYKAPKDGAATGAYAAPLDGSGKITSGANLGTDLTDDHPVNFTYDAALVASDGGLVAYATVAADPDVKLFGTTLNVQCASCHNVHNNQFVPFLRSTNTGSALCLNCHVK